jgi:hypothetical protein
MYIKSHLWLPSEEVTLQMKLYLEIFLKIAISGHDTKIKLVITNII